MRYLGHTDFEEIQARCDAAVSHPGKDDRCRHELAPETDLNELLKRYQPWEIPQKEAFYGHRDYDLDAHDAIQATRAAQESWGRWQKDPELRKHFRSFGDFLRQYELVMDSAAEAVDATAAAAGGGASQPEGGSLAPGKEDGAPAPSSAA